METTEKQHSPLPWKIFPVQYAGFWEFSIDGKYGDSLLQQDDYPNAPEIAAEIAKRYNEYKYLQTDLSSYQESYKNQCSRIDALNEENKNLKFWLSRLTLSMAAHPDCVKGSEFYDFVSGAEKVLESALQSKP
jgi:hypothetical protein